MRSSDRKPILQEAIAAFDDLPGFGNRTGHKRPLDRHSDEIRYLVEFAWKRSRFRSMAEGARLHRILKRTLTALNMKAVHASV